MVKRGWNAAVISLWLNQLGFAPEKQNLTTDDTDLQNSKWFY